VRRFLIGGPVRPPRTPFAAVVVAAAIAAVGSCKSDTGDAIVPADLDADGFSAPEDCDDRLASVHPGAPELCDGLDNDCTPETPDCPAGPDGGADAAADAGGDLDACVSVEEVCADCADQDCDGDDAPCDEGVRMAIAPESPSLGSNVVVEVFGDVAYAWVLLRHEGPAGAVEWIGCADCSRYDAGRWRWSYTLAGVAEGRHLLSFERDHVDDDPAVGTPVVCGTFDVAPDAR
jgi:hypothetical protein